VAVFLGERGLPPDPPATIRYLPSYRYDRAKPKSALPCMIAAVHLGYPSRPQGKREGRSHSRSARQRPASFRPVPSRRRRVATRRRQLHSPPNALTGHKTSVLRDATLRAAPQRLCWRSSAFWAPWLFVSQDGVEDGEKFAGRGDGDEHFGLAGVDEALAKGLEDGIVTAGDEACEKRTERTDLRPPRLAIRLPSRVPSSGSSAMSVRAVIGPRQERRRGGPPSRAMRAIRARPRRFPHQSRPAPSRARRSGERCSFGSA
jgi:hypothetical protein